MNDEQILALACARVDAEPDQVMSYRIYDEVIALVIDRGIKGGPKYILSLRELINTPEEPKAIEPEPEPEPKPKPKRKSTRKKKAANS